MSELNNLIPISYDNPERPTVSGRELHDFLEVTTRYNDWFNRMTEYGFTEGEDYYSFLSNRSDGLAGKPRTDHQLTIPMAKELCMIQRNERGKQARQYFLAVEAQWNSPEAVMRRAVLDRQTVQGLRWAIKFVSQLQTACMSEKELKHAIRLTHFRGTVCPAFQA